MVQYIRDIKKGVAIEMRKKGLSYSQIQTSTSVPKSTLAYWLRGIKLTPEQVEKLQNRQRELTQANAKKRVTRTAEKIQFLKSASAGAIKNISKRELWLMGIMLYWRERMLGGNNIDIQRGVRFTSSDPYLIKLFLKWLHDVGNLSPEEMRFDIFLKINLKNTSATDTQSLRNQAINYWSEISGYPRDVFTHLYIQKSKSGRKRRASSGAARFGFLRIRVKASSMLARQIAGWIQGVRQFYWDERLEENVSQE